MPGLPAGHRGAIGPPFGMQNRKTIALFKRALTSPAEPNLQVRSIGESTILDAGIDTRGSLEAGILLARLCLADSATVRLTPANPDLLASDNSVYVQTDHPLVACLGAQYAGWPVQTDDFFAMGSGPMRMRRGKEEVLEQLQLIEAASQVAGVLESDKLPTPAAIELIAAECGVPSDAIHLAIAPSTSIAGSVQVVARSIETAMHKLHELKFDVRRIVSATGVAPLPPPAEPGNTVAGIGRTNDAVLYGARVTLWVDCDDKQIDAVAENVPSRSSADYGRPFAEIFKDYEYDFYRVDPLLFSPAVVTFHNLKSGRTWSHGSVETDILRQSFLK